MSEVPTKSRVAKHRAKASAKGSRRVEVTVPARDANLVKAVAGALRSGGETAERLRTSIEPLVSAGKARSGTELVAFLRASPLVGEELQVERESSTGRSARLEP